MVEQRFEAPPVQVRLLLHPPGNLPKELPQQEDGNNCPLQQPRQEYHTTPQCSRNNELYAVAAKTGFPHTHRLWVKGSNPFRP